MDPAAFRAISLVRIGFSIPAAAYIVAPTGQGILFEDLVDLANEDVSTLCINSRRLRCLEKASDLIFRRKSR